MSHELRTPLTSIGLSLKILAEGTVGPLPPAAREVLAIAERNVDRMVRLANDVLDLKRLEAGRMDLRRETVAVQSVVDGCFELLRALANGRGVVLESLPTTARALGDEERIEQVLTNLLANAIKFSPVGGRIRVETRADDEWVEVRVTDEGPGVPVRYRESIFERYRQVPRSDAAARPGSGLGLAICQAIVSQSGGTMGLESEEGRGSCFWFRLPCAGAMRSA